MVEQAMAGFQLRAVLVLAWKDLRLLLRDRAGLVVTLVFPLIYAFFIGVVLADRSGTNRPLSILVLDEDQSAASEELIRRLETAPELIVATVGSPERATAEMESGRAVATVLIPSGFEAALSLAFSPSAGLTAVDDSTPGREAVLIRGLVLQHLANIRMSDRGARGGRPSPPTAEERTAVPGFMVEPVLRMDAPVRPSNPYSLTFPQGVMWGILGCTAAFGVSLVGERTRGTLGRLRMMPVGRLQILTGKAMACGATSLALSVVLFMIAWLAFGVSPDSVAKLAFGVISTSICFVGVMLLLSLIGRTEQAASGASWSVLLAMAMVGGAMVPYLFMPSWLRTVGAASPVRWALAAMEGAVWRGDSWARMAEPCGGLILVGALCLGMGTLVFRWTD